MARHKPRREPRRNELALRGFAVVLVFGVLLGLAYARVSGAFNSDPEATAYVKNAGGSLRSGADVKVAGVLVGKVTSIDRAPDGDVALGLRIYEEDLESVPDNVVARILPATVFGTTFLELAVHDGPSGTPLKDGAEIPADTTTRTLELQLALDDIDRLVNALGPAELQSAIASAASALDGRGAKIGRMVDVAERYLARLEPNVPLIRTNLSKLADNLDLVNDIAPELLDATEDGLVTLDTVVSQRAAIAAIIAGGTKLVQNGNGFLAENRTPLVRLLDNGALLLDVLYDNRRAGISGAIRTNLVVGTKAPQTVKKGFIKADGVVDLNAPRYYTRTERPDFGGGASPRRDPSFGAMAGGR